MATKNGNFDSQLSHAVIAARDRLIEFLVMHDLIENLVLAFWCHHARDEATEKRREQILGELMFSKAPKEFRGESICEMAANLARVTIKIQEMAEELLNEDVLTALEVGNVVHGGNAPAWDCEAPQEGLAAFDGIVASTFHDTVITALKIAPLISEGKAFSDEIIANRRDRVKVESLTFKYAEKIAEVQRIDVSLTKTQIRLEAARALAVIGLPRAKTERSEFYKLTVKEAAARFCDQMDGTVKEGNAKTRISRMCDAGMILSQGKGRQRRINQDSLDAVILAERNRVLEEDSD